MNSSGFLVTSLGFSLCGGISSANRDSFTSFPIWISFISLSSLIAVARTSKSMLKNIAKSRHPCHVPDLRGNAFSFSLLRMMFAMSLSSVQFSRSVMSDSL